MLCVWTQPKLTWEDWPALLPSVFSNPLNRRFRATPMEIWRDSCTSYCDHTDDMIVPLIQTAISSHPADVHAKRWSGEALPSLFCHVGGSLEQYDALIQCQFQEYFLNGGRERSSDLVSRPSSREDAECNYEMNPDFLATTFLRWLQPRDYVCHIYNRRNRPR